jgi:deazaflavin-dependent oxidoreductase (nitroreductase family)
MSTTSGPFPRGFARFNRKIANPVVRLAAGRLPPFAIVRHRGRVSGREYRTPVVAFRTRDGLLIGVLYGTGSDWVKNVLAADRADVTRLGHAQGYRRPRLVGGQEAAHLVPAAIRAPFRLLGVRAYLRLTAADQAP